MVRWAHNERITQRKAALKRKNDAQELLRGRDPNHSRGAMYLAGYAIECKLKAVAMEIYDCWTLDELRERWDVSDQEVYTHGLEALAKRLPIWNRLQQSPVRRDFSRISAWRPSWRYDHRNVSIDSAVVFLDQINQVYRWLEVNQ